MDQTLLTHLDEPRIVEGDTLLIAGIGERYKADGGAGIPAQWQKFIPHIGNVPGQVGKSAYGVICNTDEAGNMDYICGVSVSDFSRIPSDWSRVRIPEQRYAVFTHREHISAIRRTWFTIWNQWMPTSGYKAAGGPDFELYGESFNPEAGMGGLELWVSIRK